MPFRTSENPTSLKRLIKKPFAAKEKRFLSRWWYNLPSHVWRTVVICLSISLRWDACEFWPAIFFAKVDIRPHFRTFGCSISNWWVSFYDSYAQCWQTFHYSAVLILGWFDHSVVVYIAQEQNSTGTNGIFIILLIREILKGFSYCLIYSMLRT